MENPIQGMCQVGMNIWMALKSGCLVAIDFATLEVQHRIEAPEFTNEEVINMITIDNQAEQFVVVCKSGLLITVTTCLKKVEKNYSFLSLIVAKRSQENIKLSMINISSQLNVVEVCISQSTDQIELWCGCDSGAIEVFSLCSEFGKLQFKITVNTHTYSADIPQSCGIIQLKSTVDDHMIYALHGCGSVISCWIVCEQPVLNNVIKLTQLRSPGTYS